MSAGTILVCFAVKEEARFFAPPAAGSRAVRVVLTGMGRRNAERATRAELDRVTPALALSCGFAGGLKPGLASGTVLFSTDNPRLEAALKAAGAVPARFYCADRVLVTAEEKRVVREKSGADAVEMESEIVCGVCREKGLPCATVRVVLDPAEEDLPLDFNRLMNENQELDYGKLAWALVKSPGKLGSLRRLQRQGEAAAKGLAAVLEQVCERVLR